MKAATENPNSHYWRLKSRQVARTVNFGWWLETLAAPLLLTAVIGAMALLVARREFTQLGPWIPAAIACTAVLLLGLGSWLWAARKFEKPEQSLVRIEAKMLLKNSLSAAQAGVSPWPAPIGKIDAGLTWQWPRLLVPPLAAGLLLAAGIFFPVTARVAGNSSAPEQPQAWQQLSTDLDYLTQEKVVDEPYLEQARKQLDQLKSQEEEQWFSHSSLEATDSLKKSHRAESARVARELDRADAALQRLGKNGSANSPAEKNRAMEEFDQALQGLQKGAMKPNPELLAQMRQLGAKDLSNLKPEQLEQLRENVKKAAQAMKGQEGQEGQGDDWTDELLAGEEKGEGEGEAGKGAVDRGPGHSPGVLGNQRDALEIGKLTGLESKDLTRTTPGDLLGLQDGEHETDETKSSLTGGGKTEATGQGGDRVWKDSLDPAEQQTLRRFFE